MGRKKIQISRIGDERNRQVTFTKRKFGLMKKAYELSVLCDCEIALIIFNSSNKLFQYASTDMDKVLLKYTEYNEPHESRTNKDIIEALNKKEHKGCDSPEPEADQYVLTPRTEEKYNKINQEFDLMIQQNQLGTRAMQRYPNAMPVAVPVNSGFSAQGSQQSSGVVTSSTGLMQQLPAQTLPPPSHSPRPGSAGMYTHNAIYATQNGRQSHSPGVVINSSGIMQLPAPSHSPRPNSTGGMMDMSPNGYQQGSPNGAVGSPGGTVKQLSKHSPPTSTTGRPNLRVVIPSSRGDLREGEGQTRTSTNTLATPVVSMVTSGIPGTAYPSAALTSFQHNFSAELGQLGFNSPGILAGGWPGQGPLSAAVQAVGLNHPQGSLNPSVSHMQTLSVNTVNQSMNIKSEPISPPREPTPSSHLMRPPSAGQGHVSPAHISGGSNSSSPVGSNEYEGGPISKRPRVTSEGWST
ncbi:myocyte-specific enhancer factor 2A-like isoform X2 [Lineus longissimus]|uniref:myocyte-specific enhancer factor 2A-like isoform X2 n=1 Tax=Lineus longissimus TaxID=88925 RepID=UPI00315D63EF